MSRVGFLVAGVQKGGTTALASYLDRFPDIAIARGKEAHVFDAPDFDDAAPRDWAEAAFQPFFEGAPEAALRGDATPITVFHPRFIERAVAYNPSMRWIVLLRDPVARAVSHYHMERRRGIERRGMLLAFLLEAWRLRGHADDFAADSPLRWASYAARGEYRRQLAALHARVPAAQVRIVDSERLRREPAPVLAELRAFLDLPPHPGLDAHPPAFEGGYAPPSRWTPALWFLRWRLRHERGHGGRGPRGGARPGV